MARSRASTLPTPPAAPVAAPRPTPPAGLERRDQTRCPIHRCDLDPTGWCPVAQAWWYPKFACPECHAWLWDNGYCANCTPKRREFVGDYFEERYDPGAGREWGHYVRVHRGPTPVLTPDQVAGYLAQLRTITERVGQMPAREPGDEAALPAWITEGAPA